MKVKELLAILGREPGWRDLAVSVDVYLPNGEMWLGELAGLATTKDEPRQLVLKVRFKGDDTEILED